MNDNFATLEELLEAMSKGIATRSAIKPTEFNYKPMNKQAEDLLTNIPKGIFMIGSVDTQGVVSFSPNPVLHPTTETARAECKRLAMNNPGKAFIFVKVSGAELMPVTRPVSY